MNFSYDNSKGSHCLGVVIEDKHRSKGHCSKGLILLAEKAFIDLVMDRLRNDIPIDQVSAIKRYKKAGFKEVCTKNGSCILELSKEDYLTLKIHISINEY